MVYKQMARFIWGNQKHTAQMVQFDLWTNVSELVNFSETYSATIVVWLKLVNQNEQIILMSGFFLLYQNKQMTLTSWLFFSECDHCSPIPNSYESFLF